MSKQQASECRQARTVAEINENICVGNSLDFADPQGDRSRFSYEILVLRPGQTAIKMTFFQAFFDVGELIRIENTCTEPNNLTQENNG